MPNLVCPSVRPVWPNRDSISFACLPAQVAFRWCTDTNWYIFVSMDMYKEVNTCQPLAVGLVHLLRGVIEVIWIKKNMSSNSCHHSFPSEGVEGLWAEWCMFITSSWTVRHYDTVRMTHEPYADNVPLSFVPLHYGLPPSFGSCYLTSCLSAPWSFMLCSPVSFTFYILSFYFYFFSPVPYWPWWSNTFILGFTKVLKHYNYFNATFDNIKSALKNKYNLLQC